MIKQAANHLIRYYRFKRDLTVQDGMKAIAKMLDKDYNKVNHEQYIDPVWFDRREN